MCIFYQVPGAQIANWTKKNVLFSGPVLIISNRITKIWTHIFGKHVLYLLLYNIYSPSMAYVICY